MLREVTLSQASHAHPTRAAITHGAEPASTSEMARTPSEMLIQARAEPSSRGFSAFSASRTMVRSETGGSLDEAENASEGKAAAGSACAATPLGAGDRSPRARSEWAIDGG